MDSFKRFSEEKLPDKKWFYSSGKDGTTDDNGKKVDDHISDKDYLMCSKIWNKLNMKNMGDYHDHYLKKDVLILADVFAKFVDTSLKFYKLYHCHYFSSPGLSWNAMLKMTGVELEKIFDIDMYLFIEKGLRGETSYTAKRYSEANNKYMKHDPTKPSKYISYIDMNNLHGWAMSGYLHYGEFKWLKNVNNYDVNSINKKRPVGYILEVDLEYPDELHVLHNNYSLTPENLQLLMTCCQTIVKRLLTNRE